MNIAHTNWNLLKSFLAVMEAGSLLGAAKKTGGHQPTLSRHIEELEEVLGVTLFERTGRGLKPTAAAQQIMPMALEMSLSFQKMAFALMQSKASLQGTVRVSCSQVMASFLMPKVLRDFRVLHPDIQIELVSSNQVSNLLNREADIALRLVRPVQSSLIARKLGELSFGAYAAGSYLSAKGKNIAQDGYWQLADIFQCDVIGLDKDQSLIELLTAYGIAANDQLFAYRTDDHVAGIHLVAQGAGIGFMPDYVAAQFPALQSVLGQSLAQSLPVWLVTHRELKSSPLIRLAYDFLAQAISSEIGDGTVNDKGNSATVV